MVRWFQYKESELSSLEQYLEIELHGSIPVFFAFNFATHLIFSYLHCPWLTDLWNFIGYLSVFLEFEIILY